MPRPFLLIQARNHADPMREHEVDCFRRVMHIGRADLRIVNAVDRLPTSDEVAACAAVVMGGSGDYSSLDDLAWIRSLIAWSGDTLIRGNTPVFASCFGFQILVVALGGTMIRDHARTEMGTYDLELTETGLRDPLFAPLGATFTAQVGHKDRALRLPAGVDNCASTPLCPVHALRVAEQPIWATQFHPELDVPDMRLRYLHYRDLYLPRGAPTPGLQDDPFLRGLRPSQAACALPARFVDWVRGRERARPRAARKTASKETS